MVKRTHNCRIGKKNYELYYNNEALYEFEGVHGVSAMVVIASGQLGAREITHFLWAGLLHDPNQSLPLEEVKRLIPVSGYVEIAEIIAQAVGEAFDTGEKESESKNEKADQSA